MDFSLNKIISINVPSDASNISLFLNISLVSNSSEFNLILYPREELLLTLKFFTEPVEMEVVELDLDLIALLPPEARNIQLFDKGRLIASYPNLERVKLKIPGLEKKIFVYHNSSLHYHNIRLEIPLVSENFTFIRTVGEEEIEIEVVGKDKEKIFWTIPKLSGVNATLKLEPEKIQGKAEIGKPVNWTMKISNYTVNYETTAPEKIEETIKTGKRIIILSNASDHYYNVTAYTELPDISYRPRLYRIVDGIRIDVSEENLYDVNYLDIDSDGKYDKLEWNVPKLSNDTYEIELIILNIQSYPSVKGNWTVRFTTMGISNLVIKAVDDTTWTDYSESGHDLKFLEIKCGDKILDYEWIDGSVFIRDYFCNETGYEISKVLTMGKHKLEFRFGDIVKYAYNEAGWLTGWSYRKEHNITEPSIHS
jgi:hypothetical protein